MLGAFSAFLKACFHLSSSIFNVYHAVFFAVKPLVPCYTELVKKISDSFTFQMVEDALRYETETDSKYTTV